jgi:DNA/RNA-binding domain of Phe-tRNA-synthetase-like protein
MGPMSEADLTIYNYMSSRTNKSQVTNEASKMLAVTKVVDNMTQEECEQLVKHMQRNTPMSELDKKTQEKLKEMQKAFGN